MAELLIRVVDKINDDVYKNAQCTKRGDVIVAQADGWQWGRVELSDPRYRIVRIPTLTVDEARAFTAPEPHTGPGKPSPTLQKRAFKFDVDHHTIPADFAAWLADDSRAVPIHEASLHRDHAHALVSRRPPIQDPAVIGTDNKEIG
jgi:hypothetical protein